MDEFRSRSASVRPPPAAGRKTIEEWAADKGHGPGTPEAWRFAAAKGLRAWADGAEVSEADYDKALEDAGNIQLGYAAGR